MPHHFSTYKKHPLILENEATLGEELLLVFDEDDIKKEQEKLIS